MYNRFQIILFPHLQKDREINKWIKWLYGEHNIIFNNVSTAIWGHFPKYQFYLFSFRDNNILHTLQHCKNISFKFKVIILTVVKNNTHNIHNTQWNEKWNVWNRINLDFLEFLKMWNIRNCCIMPTKIKLFWQNAQLIFSYTLTNWAENFRIGYPLANIQCGNFWFIIIPLFWISLLYCNRW